MFPQFLRTVFTAALFSVCLPLHVAHSAVILQNETELATLINQARVDEGVAPVGLDLVLFESAGFHSQDMATNNFFGHTSSDGTSFFDRIHSFGYPGGAGEVIARGTRTASDTLALFLGDALNRDVILNPSWQAMGVGYATGSFPYWTVDFGLSLPVNPVPAPSSTLLFGTGVIGLVARAFWIGKFRNQFFKK